METTLSCEQCHKSTGRRYWFLVDDNYEATLHIKCATLLNESGLMDVTRIKES